MKQRHILVFFISCCFILHANNLLGQETENNQQKPEIVAKTANIETDSIAYKKSYGLRVGIDIGKPILSAIKGNYNGFEIIADYRIKRNLYIAAEIGAEEQNKNRDTYAFTGKGSYITAGINYNTFKNWLEMDNEIYIGARYGFSLFDQTVEDFTYYQEGTIIDGVPGPYFYPAYNDVPRTYENLTAHWMGLLFGLKVETFKNLYLGAHIQFNFILSQTQPPNFLNQYIPGFGKVYSTGTGIGFGYSISYRIPLYKK